MWDGMVTVGQDGVATETSKSGYVIVLVPGFNQNELVGACLNTLVELVGNIKPAQSLCCL